MNQLIRN